MDFQDISPQIAEVAKSYKYQKPPDMMVLIQDWVEKFLRWVSDLLASLHIVVPGLADTRSVGNVMQFVLVLMGCICVVALIFAVLSRMRHLRLQSQLARKGQSVLESLLDSQGWRKQAAELEAAQLHKEACRALYLSLLRLLDESGVLEFTPTRTNYEYWYALKKYQPVALQFKDIAASVESVWFGPETADAAKYSRCLAILEKAEREVKAEVEKGAIKPKE